MAQNISLTSGSILNGNPITLAVTPNTIANASMHRIILEVECGMSGGNYEIIKMSVPVLEESSSSNITFDISSALRTFRDSYEYVSYPVKYPIVKFNVKAYDEYMSEGMLHRTQPIFYPTDPNILPEERRDEAYMRTIFGAFTDMERTLSKNFRGVKSLTKKPQTTPQIAFVGEQVMLSKPYSTERNLMDSNTLEPPSSTVVTVAKEGVQRIGDVYIYALPATAAKNRRQFRFVNSFGVVESIGVPKEYSRKAAFQTQKHIVSREQTFNKTNTVIARKGAKQETWMFKTDALDEEWTNWYLYEFFTSEHIWMLIPYQGAEIWVPVNILPEEEITYHNAEDTSMYGLTFSVELCMEGSVTL